MQGRTAIMNFDPFSRISILFPFPGFAHFHPHGRANAHVGLKTELLFSSPSGRRPSPARPGSEAEGKTRPKLPVRTAQTQVLRPEQKAPGYVESSDEVLIRLPMKSGHQQGQPNEANCGSNPSTHGTRASDSMLAQ